MRPFSPLPVFAALGLSVLVPPALASGEGEGAGAEIVSLDQIWDRAPHNAFTDLIRFRDQWYCAFREATDHHSPDGKLRVIRSQDGETWESVALMEGEAPGDDVRDAKLSLTSEGHLMLNGAIAFKDDPARTRQSVTWISEDGESWSGPHACPTGLDTWRWSATWHDASAYSLAYTGKDQSGTLYRSEDGVRWKAVAEDLFPQAPDGRANEASLSFQPDGTALCLLRRDPVERSERFAPGANAVLGVASPPYREWDWRDLGVRMGGPKLLRLKDGRHIAAVRHYGEPGAAIASTALYWIDPEKGAVSRLLRLPSGGDTSYAGLVEHEGLLWMSYYSSHEERTSIYLARIRLPAPQP